MLLTYCVKGHENFKHSMVFLNKLVEVFMVIMQTSSAETMYVIPNACHLVICYDSHFSQNTFFLSH